MNVKMTNREAVELINTLSSLTVKGADPKFMYAVARTVEHLKPVLRSVMQAQKYDSDRYQEYINKKQEIFKECSDKDDGMPNVREGENQQLGRVVPIQRQSEFLKKNELLDATFADVKEELTKHQKAFEELLDSEVEVKVHAVLGSKVPLDQLDQATINKIFIMIDDDLDSK